MTELRVLDVTGDIKIVWDPADEASLAKAREEVERLKAAGYTFFLVDGTPGDVEGANGELSARYVSPEELTEAAPAEKRGRKGVPNRQAVAVRPMRGG